MEFVSITGANEQFTSSGSSLHRGSFVAVNDSGAVYDNQLMSGSTTSLMSVGPSGPMQGSQPTSMNQMGGYPVLLQSGGTPATTTSTQAPQWQFMQSPPVFQQQPQYVLVPWSAMHQQTPSAMPTGPAPNTSSVSPMPVVMSQSSPMPPNTFASAMNSHGVAPNTMMLQPTPQHPVMAVPPPPATSVPALHPGIHDSVGPMVVGGRLRHGANVHTELKHVCKYISYRDGDAMLKQDFQSGPRDQVLPLFVQMFPSEHKDHAAALFEKVLTLICGPGAGRVVGIESRSETSFIVLVKTGYVWHLLYNMHYRVLMDRHGFWYAENVAQYLQLKEYCDRVRTLPQQTRRTKTDGMPSMPLVVELSRTVSRTTILAPPAPASFDVLVQVGNSAAVTAPSDHAARLMPADVPAAAEICA